MVNINPLLKEKNLDALVLVSPKLEMVDPAFIYCTGLLDYERAIYVGGSTKRVYVTNFEIPRARKDSFLKNVRPRPKKGFETILKQLKGKTVGINGKSLPVNSYKMLRKHNVKTRDVSRELTRMMMIKTPAEIAKLRKAIKFTKGMFKLIEPGKSELNIAADMAHYLMRNRAGWSFDPIISYGKNAAIPHAKPSETKNGICLLCDIGATWKGYHADITRTFALKRDKRFDKAYEVVREAHDMAIDAVEPGKTAKEIHDICANHLKKNKYKLNHSTGHGIGLTIHEWPYIGEKHSKTTLEPGMVFTVEPGVYIKGKFGIRIEDDILVTKTGRTVLSR